MTPQEQLAKIVDLRFTEHQVKALKQLYDKIYTAVYTREVMALTLTDLWTAIDMAKGQPNRR